jgi:hypothetical protein
LVIAVNAWVPVVGTIAGLLVGVIGGGLMTWFVETRRWKREDQIRWYPDRRQVYSRFLKAADNYSRAGTQLARAVGALDPSTGSGMDEVNKAHEEVGRTYRALVPEEFEIELVAGPEVREAAAHVVHLADERMRAELLEVRRHDFDAKVVAAAVEAADKAAEEATEGVERFKHAARAEIGVGGD